uniref:NAD(P)-binding domain-containing protein n=1 Tax=Ananas comosus var. bracteatus TaxID=296719 RepID=A0A6V7Q8A3_ANACO|nr:unnamed protein product [Ananas comosus var. bracteatus]
MLALRRIIIPYSTLAFPIVIKFSPPKMQAMATSSDAIELEEEKEGEEEKKNKRNIFCSGVDGADWQENRGEVAVQRVCRQGGRHRPRQGRKQPPSEPRPAAREGRRHGGGGQVGPGDWRRRRRGLRYRIQAIVGSFCPLEGRQPRHGEPRGGMSESWGEQIHTYQFNSGQWSGDGQILNLAYIVLNVFGLTLIAKLQAEQYVRKSGINYTIIRPGGLRDEPAAGNIIMEPEDTLYEGSISRDQVADVAVEALECPESFYKVVEIVARADASNRSIKDLFSSIKQK